jgi:hypothetical protein
VPSVEFDKDEVGVAPQRTSTVPAWCVLVLGGVSVVSALWFTVGPWTVSIGGRSYGCGSAFMGRYRSAPDPAATTAVACHLQAANRMHVAEIAWLIGLVLVVLGVVLLLRARRRSEGPVRP